MTHLHKKTQEVDVSYKVLLKKYFTAIAYGICRISGNSPSTDDLDVTEKFNGCGKALFVVTNECAKM